MEVYAFANCASSMRYIDPENHHPYIESYANRRDIVARLGALSPENKPNGLVCIDGPVFENRASWKNRHSGWGHLLNQHYLFAIEDHLVATAKGKPSKNPYPLQPGKGYSDIPRLYGYFHGGCPEPIGDKE